MYTDLELDALREIGNIGAGHAATALSTLLNKTIKINVPKARIVPFNDIISSVGGPEKAVVGVFVRITGHIDGNILIMMDQEAAYAIADMLIAQKTPRHDGLTDMQKSALLELGNILGSSYMVAMSDFTKLLIKVSVPSLAQDMAGALISFPLSLYGYMGDTAFLIDTEFIEGLDGTKLHFFLIPDDESLKLLLKAIGVDAVERNDPSRNGGL